jgi:hypothetical protein
LVVARIGILGCPRSSCRELADLAAAVKEARGVFKELGPLELVGCVTCGRHPEKGIFDGATLLAKWGADIIAVATGDGEGEDSDNRLYRERIIRELSRRLGPTIILDCRSGFGV